MTSLESLSDELFVHIFARLPWAQLITSFWSLNKRFNTLIRSTLSNTDNPLHRELSFTEPGISLVQCRALFSATVLRSPVLLASIRRIHFDGLNSTISDSFAKWLYDTHTGELLFPNLRSLALTHCLLLEHLGQNLPRIIRSQVKDLTLTFDDDVEKMERATGSTSDEDSSEADLSMRQRIIRQLFSSACQLTTLALDITRGDEYSELHYCLEPSSDDVPEFHPEELRVCVSLRELTVHLNAAYFLECLVNHVPLLEKLRVHMRDYLYVSSRPDSNVETLIQTDGLWRQKMPRLRCFVLKTIIYNDREFRYLKWILNNVNHVQKLRLQIKSERSFGKHRTIWQSVVDAAFVRRHCLPDMAPNLTDFGFYISSKGNSTVDRSEQIIRSFRTDRFFVERGWTDVKCCYDPKTWRQHLSNYIVRQPQFDALRNDIQLFCRPQLRRVSVDLHPSLYLLLERFDELFPRITDVYVHMETYEATNAVLLRPLNSPFVRPTCPFREIRWQYVTTLNLEPKVGRMSEDNEGSTLRAETRVRLLARLLSMPVQLKVLRISHFVWLLDAVQRAPHAFRANALHTVRYAEFHIPSCNHGVDDFVYVGKELVPFLRAHVPHLQTLHLLRPDDLPWTSVRPDFATLNDRELAASQWEVLIGTPEIIGKHVEVFERDLSDLLEHMSELVFLDIQAKILAEQVEPYRAMVLRCFPHSCHNVEQLRFRLWR